MRKLASVRKVDALKPIEGADAIECAVAWVWNPAKEAWEQVRAFKHWQQGAIYAFGPTPPAAPLQEPHSWYSAEHDEWMTDKTRKEHERLNSYTHKVGGFDLPLYNTPPAAPVQEPVALKHRLVKIHDALGAHLGDTDPDIPEDMTDEEVCEYEPVFWAAKEIADLIGDAPWSNFTTPPAAPVQEPAYEGEPDMHAYASRLEKRTFEMQSRIDQLDFELRMARTTSPAAQRQWVGLTDEEIMEVTCIHDDPEEWPEVISEARAIEAKLREKNGGGI